MTVKITVVGCGVSGLTTATLLKNAGYDVTILTRQPPLATTSMKAAAIWLPYGIPDTPRTRKWAQQSFIHFAGLNSDRDSGVSWTTLMMVGMDPADSRLWWSDIPNQSIEAGRPAAFSSAIPLIDAPVYIPWLVSRFEGIGGRIVIHSVESFDQILSSDMIINCSGLGSHSLAQDTTVYGLRGQTARVLGPDLNRCIVDERGPLVYIVPRSDGVILGGTAQEVRDLSPRGIGAALIPSSSDHWAIVENCQSLEPGLRTATLREISVGIRPARSGGVRLELEDGPQGRIVHNYGHGGAGFTLSWGCAQEVLEIVGACMP